MSKIPILFLVLLLASVAVRAQAPNGIIAGVVSDSKSARVPTARITITNRENGLTRNVISSAEGEYSAAALPSGVYQLIAEADGFRRIETTATVVAGTTTTVNLTLEPGEIREQVTIADAAPLMNYESNQVGGVVTRKQIENLPLNGRNFLDLAKLEPGVTNTVRGTNNRVFVPTLGAGVQTSPRIGNARVTMDGASINAIGGIIGSYLQAPNEVVQEFQISTVNFDLATSVTSTGAINIVTRSGGQEFHGSGFYFFRDHKLSAYPGLSRDPNNPSPFFQRSQFGFNVGGPIRKDRFFFFTSYERNDQRGVVSVQPRTPEFAPLGGIFSSPYVGNQFNLRLDMRLNQNNEAFVRYTHDGNRTFAPVGGGVTFVPSAWSRIQNWVDQNIFGLTTVLSPNLVNDLRFSYFFGSSPEIPATKEDCSGCLGAGAPSINIPDAGVQLGTARRLSLVGRRYELVDGLVWQRSNHRFRVGFDWEHNAQSAQALDQEPAALELYSPRQVQLFNATQPIAGRIPLPTSFLTLDDILRLPLRSFLTSVGPSLLLQRDFRKVRIGDLYRLYAADTWHASSRFTLSYGLGWFYEPNALNTNLTKPPLLTGILGMDQLHPPRAQKTNFSPSVGFAWAATRDSRTVIRGGIGKYFDAAVFNAVNVNNELRALSPSGSGRRTNIPGSSIFFQGVPLSFTQRPTTFTAADLLTILPGIRADLLRELSPDNRDFTFRNINLNKSGLNLTDASYENPYAIHFNLGVQRELGRDVALTADFAWRRFLHTFLPDIDYNRFNRKPQGPLIPRCTSTQQNDLSAICSSGPITFDATAGIAEYKGLLVRLEKRFSDRTQFLGSYALGSFKGTNGTAAGSGFNIDDWFENYGPFPTDIRHILNVSGVFDLPRRFQLSFSVSAFSSPPFSAFVSGIDFNGDGTTSDLLPGTEVNQFNRGLDRNDLPNLVATYNQQFAGKITIGGQVAPTLTLPADYSFNDSFFTQDLRLSRSFSLGSERAHLTVLGEVFNLFNTANLIGFSGNIANPASFAKAGARFSQVFGSGGPRAFQFGARLSF